MGISHALQGAVAIPLRLESRMFATQEQVDSKIRAKSLSGFASGLLFLERLHNLFPDLAVRLLHVFGCLAVWVIMVGVVLQRIRQHEIHVFEKGLQRGVFHLFDFSLNVREIHGCLDHIKVIRCSQTGAAVPVNDQSKWIGRIELGKFHIPQLVVIRIQSVVKATTPHSVDPYHGKDWKVNLLQGLLRGLLRFLSL